mmetsp:Transcript_10624/g.15559  ORF Transcript_10624/g.15559 Transcript_10624/m.15559 type:complete len:205 (+) Transcript_10624:160-774(+)
MERICISTRLLYNTKRKHNVIHVSIIYSTKLNRTNNNDTIWTKNITVVTSIITIPITSNSIINTTNTTTTKRHGTQNRTIRISTDVCDNRIYSIDRDGRNIRICSNDATSVLYSTDEWTRSSRNNSIRIKTDNKRSNRKITSRPYRRVDSGTKNISNHLFLFSSRNHSHMYNHILDTIKTTICTIPHKKMYITTKTRKRIYRRR